MEENRLYHPPPLHRWQETIGKVTNDVLDFTGLPTGYLYRLLFRCNADNILVTFNGSGANYNYCNHAHGDNAGAYHGETHANAAASLILSPVSYSDKYFDGELYFNSAYRSHNETRARWLGFQYKDTDEYLAFNGAGFHGGASTMNRVTLTDVAGGNFSSAWGVLYRVIDPARLPTI